MPCRSPSIICPRAVRSVLLGGLLAACAPTVPGVSGVAGTAPTPNALWTPPAGARPDSAPARITVSVPADLEERIKQLTLQDVVDLALRNNPATRISWANARASAAALGAARGAYYPQVDLGVTASRTKTAAAAGNVGVEQNVLQPGGNLSWLLFDFGSRGGAVDRARQALYASNWIHNQVVQDVVLEVEVAYFNYIAQRALLAAQQSSLDEAETNLAATEERRKVGLATIAEVLQARTARSQAELALETTDGDRQTARGALALSLGLPANLPYDVDSAAVNVPVTAIADSVDTLIDLAIRARPDLAAAEADFRGAQARVRELKGDRAPSLTLTGNGRRVYTTTIPNGDNAYTLSLGLSIPLFSGFTRLYTQREAEAQVGAVRAQIEGLRQQVVYQVFSAYYALQTATRRVQTSEDLLASATQSADAMRARYKAGVGSLLDLLSAQSSLADARSQRVQARLAWYSSLALLAHASGLLDTRGGSPLHLGPDSTPPIPTR